MSAREPAARRLQALELRRAGYSYKEIARKLAVTYDWVNETLRTLRRQGHDTAIRAGDRVGRGKVPQADQALILTMFLRDGMGTREIAARLHLDRSTVNRCVRGARPMRRAA